MTDEERFIYNHGYGQAKRDFIKELEKINTEFLAKCPNTNARTICMSIVNNHIKELKGENKC